MTSYKLAVSLVATVCDNPSCMVCSGKRDATAVVTGGRDGNGGAKVSDEINEAKASIEVIYDRVIREKVTGQWIDVKGLKPKVGETALFSGRYDTSVGVWRGVVDINDELIVDTAMGACTLSATHWMPIPELPVSP